jgi:hypothetical protein
MRADNDREAPIMTVGSASMSERTTGTVVLLPSRFHRSGLIAAGIGYAPFAVWAGVVDVLWWWLSLPLAVLLVLEGVRVRVVVDHDHQQIISTRAVIRSVVPIADVVNVRVPPWGPVILTLRPGLKMLTSRGRSGQLLTGLIADHRGEKPVAAHLAAAIGVPVVSVWPRVRTEQPSSD